MNEMQLQRSTDPPSSMPAQAMRTPEERTGAALGNTC